MRAARDASGFLGYATYGTFRIPAQCGTFPLCARGCGIGKALLAALIDKGRALVLHILIGGIDSDSSLCIALHKAFGFEETGRLPETGRKFDRWLTLVFLQKRL